MAQILGLTIGACTRKLHTWELHTNFADTWVPHMGAAQRGMGATGEAVCCLLFVYYTENCAVEHIWVFFRGTSDLCEAAFFFILNNVSLTRPQKYGKL